MRNVLIQQYFDNKRSLSRVSQDTRLSRQQYLKTNFNWANFNN
jgi:hypothetical protein